MIFIEALKKLQPQQTGHHRTHILRKRFDQVQQDSVELSDEAAQAVEFELDESHKRPLNAEMSITATLLQKTLAFLCGYDIQIVSLTDLKPARSDWRLELQKPPVSSFHQSRTYSAETVVRKTEKLLYQFHIPLLSTGASTYDFNMYLYVPRFTAESNQWSLPSNNHIIELGKVKTPYSSFFLKELEKNYEFLLDQDGDSNQLTQLTSIMTSNFATPPAPQNLFYTGLRVWRLDNNQLLLTLLGAPEIGALFTANLAPTLHKPSSEAESDNKSRPTYSRLDVEA